MTAGCRVRAEWKRKEPGPMLIECLDSKCTRVHITVWVEAREDPGDIQAHAYEAGKDDIVQSKNLGFISDNE